MGVKWLVGIFGVILASACAQMALAEEAKYQVPWVRIIPEKASDMESGQCLLEVYSYYMGYKKSSRDCAALGGLVRMDIGYGWEIRAFGDTLSWQDPMNMGLGDVAAGVKWNFLKGAFSAAATFDVEFPSGAKEFREPGPEPTLAFILGRKFGSVESTCTVSSTYVSTEGKEKDYFNALLSLGLDWTLNDVHSLGVFATGYTPAGSKDHSSRISAGTCYTYTLNECNSYNLTFTKGFSGRGMDWSLCLSYDFYFNLRSLFKGLSGKST